ncbi:MAG: hypothetical protein IPL84_18105 [Chitinophagaceae bacterium]|nr:hypothetical protein [Chitinophagaceae bacterium]
MKTEHWPTTPIAVTCILPANTEIVPYDNGYYAEFTVNSFSEFWLNNGEVWVA